MGDVINIIDAIDRRIQTESENVIEASIEIGRLLIEAKAELDDASFKQHINHYSYSQREADQLMKLADKPTLSQTDRKRLIALAQRLILRWREILARRSKREE